MTELLVRIFIKNKEDVKNSSVRSAYGFLSSIVGILCNVMLFAVKLTAGLLMNSISVMADAFNNLSDAASSIISFVGVKLAGRPADEEHPFGHGRYEYISALIVAFLVLQVGISCFQSSFKKIIHPETISFHPVIVGILCITVLVKIWMALFNRKLGKRINSKVMQATAADSIGDVLVTGATIISLVVGTLSGLNIDGYMGVIVSVMVLIAGFNIARDTLEPLLGEAVDREVYDLITKRVEAHEGIIGSHDLIVHNYGPTHSMATIHAEVPNTVDIEEAHELIDRIEREILKELNIFLVIHMDPVEINDKNVTEKKELVAAVVKELEPHAAIHDFRMVNGENQINLIFDLVIPYSCQGEEELKLVHGIMQKVKEKDSRLECVMNIENSFVQQKKEKK